MGNKEYRAEQAWSEMFGKAIAVMSTLFGFLRDLWSKMGIDPRILDWLKTDRGKLCARDALTQIGQAYLDAITDKSLRFQGFDILDANDRVTVNCDLPPIPPIWHDKTLPVHKNTGSGLVEIKRVGEDVFVGGRKLIIRHFADEGADDTVDKAAERHVHEKDAVNGSVLDALLEYSCHLIPEKWRRRKINHIYFTGTTFGEENEEYPGASTFGYRCLSFGDHKWGSSFSPFFISWSGGHGFDIAMLEPENELNSEYNEYFDLAASFEITVPRDYVHGTQLATFEKKQRKQFTYWDENITDGNYAKASNHLVPGKTYAVKIFGIKKQVDEVDYLAFLAQQKIIFAGAQGLSLVWQLAKEKIPVGKSMFSYDKKDALWRESPNGLFQVPYLNVGQTGKWQLGRYFYGSDLGDSACLLCICEKET